MEKVRDAAELKMAHDLMDSVLDAAKTGKIKLPQEWAVVIRSSRDLLCWALQHEDNNAFAENLANVAGWMKEQGYGLVNKQEGKPN